MHDKHSDQVSRAASNRACRRPGAATAASRQAHSTPFTPLPSHPHCCRVLYPLEMALDVVQALLACSLFHASYSIAGGTGAFRCWTCLLAGNGVLALVALTKTSPLTFKWQLPALVAIGGTLLALAPGWAESNPLLQHGFSLLITLARILLPILAPAFVDLSPPEGFSALLASAPDPSQLSEAEAAARAAACAAAQAATVLLGCCSLALSQHRAEQRQRKQFVLAAYAAQRQQQQQQQQ